jgi:hypothetical protein
MGAGWRILDPAGSGKEGLMLDFSPPDVSRS